MAAALNKQIVDPRRQQPFKLLHFSHRHALKRLQMQRKDDIKCAICNLPVVGEVYGCKNCSYYLHKPCFNLPPTIRRSAHNHQLTLHSTPADDSGVFLCRACGNNGNGFNYHCRSPTCNYDLHVSCASFPGSMMTGFKYEITLYYSFPIKSEAAPITCDLCLKPIDKKFWLYYNRDADFVAHLRCAFRKRYAADDIEDLVDAAQKRLKCLELND